MEFRMITIGPDRVLEAANVLADAFFNEPVAAALLPDEATRHDNLWKYFGMVSAGSVRFGHCCGIVENSNRLCAVAASYDVWPLTEAESVQANLEEWRRQIDPVAIERYDGLYAPILEFYARLRQGEQFRYLAAIGTVPESRGRGHASTLLQELIREANRSRLPCWLETFNAGNVGLYEKHGYVLVSNGAIPWLPECGPLPPIMMQRPARR